MKFKKDDLEAKNSKALYQKVITAQWESVAINHPTYSSIMFCERYFAPTALQHLERFTGDKKATIEFLLHIAQYQADVQKMADRSHKKLSSIPERNYHKEFNQYVPANLCDELGDLVILLKAIVNKQNTPSFAHNDGKAANMLIETMNNYGDIFRGAQYIDFEDVAFGSVQMGDPYRFIRDRKARKLLKKTFGERGLVSAEKIFLDEYSKNAPNNYKNPQVAFNAVGLFEEIRILSIVDASNSNDTTVQKYYHIEQAANCAQIIYGKDKADRIKCLLCTHFLHRE